MELNMNIIESSEYENMLARVTFEDMCNHLKKNQGHTLQTLSGIFKENSDSLKQLLDIWIEKWHTYFVFGGRIIVKDDKYYCLSPRSSESRKRKPVINLM